MQKIETSLDKKNYKPINHLTILHLVFYLSFYLLHLLLEESISYHLKTSFVLTQYFFYSLDQIKYFEVPTKAEDFDILENIKNIWGKVYICNGVTDK